MLVTLENMKSAVTSVDSLALTDLAALCGQVANRNEEAPNVSTKARGFETEWRLLIQLATPPPPALTDKQAIDVEAAALAGRMVMFLTRELPNLSVLTARAAG
jgi:hypothetical protein